MLFIRPYKFISLKKSAYLSIENEVYLGSSNLLHSELHDRQRVSDVAVGLYGGRSGDGSYDVDYSGHSCLFLELDGAGSDGEG